MTTWTLQTASEHFPEVIRRALAHEPQVITSGQNRAVVVLAKQDYERLVAPPNIVDFLRNSPVAAAMATGELPEDAFERRDNPRRDVDR